jgi:hypothetical protein
MEERARERRPFQPPSLRLSPHSSLAGRERQNALLGCGRST